MSYEYVAQTLRPKRLARSCDSRLGRRGPQSRESESRNGLTALTYCLSYLSTPVAARHNLQLGHLHIQISNSPLTLVTLSVERKKKRAIEKNRQAAAQHGGRDRAQYRYHRDGRSESAWVPPYMGSVEHVRLISYGTCRWGRCTHGDSLRAE
jgi:hypothetical protein